MKIHKIVTIRAAHFGPGMHKIVCWLGLRPRPPSWIKGRPTSKGVEGKKQTEREGREAKVGEIMKGERSGRFQASGPGGTMIRPC